MKRNKVNGKGNSLEMAVVIPTLNEEMSMVKLLEQIISALSKYKYRILVVDGFSTDNTVKIAKDKDAIVIFQRSKGYGDALLTGFLYVNKHLDSDTIVMMDADLTYDPKYIPRLVEPIREGRADFVVGNRLKELPKGAMPFLNRVGNRLLSWLARQALKIDVYDTQSGMRAFRSELVEKMGLVSKGMPFATEMLAKAKFADARITEVPIVYRPRLGGDPKLNPIRDGLRIFVTILRLAWRREGYVSK